MDNIPISSKDPKEQSKSTRCFWRKQKAKKLKEQEEGPHLQFLY